MGEYICKNSSLISKIEYDKISKVLTIHFKKYYVDQLTYVGVDERTIVDFLTADSTGKFYLNFIKSKFNLKTEEMADKIIKIKIDVTKINKKWLYIGDKGTYLNVTMLYNDEQDQHGNNGMLVQDVPKEIYEAEKRSGAAVKTKGPILGNGKVFGAVAVTAESKPGVEYGKLNNNNSVDDDLPF